MYEQFFGLNREPFSVAPDPHFIYLSPKHREALAHLMYGLRRGTGFVLLTGEVGAGKTTVWRAFLEQLPPNTDVAYVVNPKLDARALLTRVCEDLRIELPAGANDLIDAIHGHLLLASAQGRRTIIVVDEAQALSIDVLEQLRLLTNLDATGGKLQVLLIGQPELRTMLQHPRLEPVAQRVVARFHLPALPEAETGRYVAHRLTVAGLVGEVPFDDAALRVIHRVCAGVPRRINVLCDRAMMTAEAGGSRRIDDEAIERAATEMFGSPDSPAPVPPALSSARLWREWRVIGAAFGGAIVATGLVLGLNRLGKPTARVEPPPSAAAPAASAAGATPGAHAPGEEADGTDHGHAAAEAAAEALLAASGANGPAARDPAPTPADTTRPGPPGASNGPAPTGPAPTSPGSATASHPATSPPAAAAVGDGAAASSSRTLDGLVGTAAGDESTAFQGLGRLWDASLSANAPCVAAVPQGLRCFRGLGLAPLRQLNRPAVLKLSDGRGRTAYPLLVGLGDDVAVLRAGDAEVSVPLIELSRRWHGEFATLWRPPPGYREGQPVLPGDPLARWVADRLARVEGPSTARAGADDLTARIFSFQLAQGLKPDGVAGPLTLMQLNRASGVAEPRLLAAR